MCVIARRVVVDVQTQQQKQKMIFCTLDSNSFCLFTSVNTPLLQPGQMVTVAISPAQIPANTQATVALAGADRAVDSNGVENAQNGRIEAIVTTPAQLGLQDRAHWRLCVARPRRQRGRVGARRRSCRLAQRRRRRGCVAADGRVGQLRVQFAHGERSAARHATLVSFR